MRAVERILSEASRCVLAVAAHDGPRLLPSACWWDGAHLWTPLDARAAVVTALRGAARAAAWIPGDGEGVLASGPARVFGVGSPLRSALHAPGISGAVLGLGLRDPRAWTAPVPGGARRLPSALRLRVLGRIEVSATQVLPVPAAGGARPGGGPIVSPPLPAEAPPQLRRALAGQRQVVVALGGADDSRTNVAVSAEPSLAPATWRAGARGIALDPPAGTGIDQALSGAGDVDGGRVVTCLVDVGLVSGQLGAAGIELRGRARDGEVEVGAVTWWLGGRGGEAEVAPAVAGGIELPD